MEAELQGILGSESALLNKNEEEFKPTAYVQSILGSDSAERARQQLDAGLQVVNAELGGQVSEKYDTLIANVQATHAVEAKLLRSNERIEALSHTVRRIQAQNARPYAKLVEGTAQLERMQQSAELLRQTQRAIVLCKRLHESMSPSARPFTPRAAAATTASAGGDAAASATCAAAATPTAAAPAAAASPPRAPARRADLPKAATALHELEQILNASDLSGVEVIDAEAQFIAQSGGAVRAQSTATLKSGIAEQSQAQIGSSLQVFFNLGELKVACSTAAADVASTVSLAVATALDPSIFGPEAAQRASSGGGVLADLGAGGSSRNGMPPSSALAAWRGNLWSRLEIVCEAYFVAALRLAGLQRVLGKKRDPLSHRLFASVFDDEGAARAAKESNAARFGDISGMGIRRWECADLDILESVPLLKGLLPLLPPEVVAAAEATRQAKKDASSGGGEGGAGRLFAPGGGGSGGGGVSGRDLVLGAEGLFGASPRGLLVLWAPLSLSLRAAISKACSDSPFVRHTLSTELPRLLDTFFSASERAEQHLLPAPLPLEAQAPLCAEGIIECLSAPREVYQRDLLASLNASCDAQLAQFAGGGAASGGGGASGANSSGSRLGLAVAYELQRCAGLAPLLRLVIAAGAQAVSQFSSRAEAFVLQSAEHGAAASESSGERASAPGGAPSASESAAREAATAANREVLVAVQDLRGDVHAALDEFVSAEIGAPLRAALSKLGAVCAALANPSTPLPEALLADAASLLKSVLRSEMIDDEKAE